MTNQIERAREAFTEYFVRNYPGPDTIISDPRWHAPRIFRAVLATLTNEAAPAGEVVSYAAFQQRRGRLPDLIEEAIQIHADFMADDDYDAYRCLDRVVAKLKTAREFYDAASLAPQTTPDVGVLEALRDPNVVHVNMLRGSIARPSVAQIIHIYGEDTLRAALNPVTNEGESHVQ
jgi:hypothetical protein